MRSQHVLQQHGFAAESRLLLAQTLTGCLLLQCADPYPLSSLNTLPERLRDFHTDSAVESFFGTLKRELVYRRTWPTRGEARPSTNVPTNNR